MRVCLLNLIVLMITLGSFNLNLNEVSFSFEGVDSVAASPLLDHDPLRNPTTKNSFDEIVKIQEGELASANFADLSHKSQSPFIYYLPIYSLVRAKEYFLLI